MADVPLMSNPMTTAGDILYGGASGSPTRLAAGTTGQVLKMNSGATAPEWGTGAGGISSGTSFPGSPSTDDLFHRTDRDLIYFYDGTRWLCTCPHDATLATFYNDVYSANGHDGGIPMPYTGTYDIYVTRVDYCLFITGTNNGSNYWTVRLQVLTSAGAEEASVGSVDTSADAAATFLRKVSSPGVVLDTDAVFARVRADKTAGNPGAVNIGCVMSYRLVG